MRKEIVKETDFKNEERPDTRLKQFFDIFKHRFVELLKISLLQAVYNVPLIVSLILFYALIRNSENVNSTMTIFLIQGASFLISLPVAFIGMMGTFYCMKKLAYAEGEFASSSFFIGVREEWMKGLVIGLIAGISLGLGLIGIFFSYVYLSQVNSVTAGLCIAMLGIQFIIVMMVCYYSVAQSEVYANKLRYTLKNSFIMTLMRFPYNLVVFIIYPGIFIALFSIMEITMYIGVVLLLFFTVFGHLMWILNCLSAFDAFINKEQYPDYYKKGLNKEVSKED